MARTESNQQTERSADETNSVYINDFRPDFTGKYFVTGGLGALGIEVRL